MNLCTAAATPGGRCRILLWYTSCGYLWRKSSMDVLNACALLAAASTQMEEQRGQKTRSLILSSREAGKKGPRSPSLRRAMRHLRTFLLILCLCSKTRGTRTSRGMALTSYTVPKSVLRRCVLFFSYKCIKGDFDAVPLRSYIYSTEREFVLQ